MHVLQINYAYDSSLASPEALVERYATLTGWSEALVATGVRRVTVVQRFSRDAELTRAGVRYLFRPDDGPPVADDRTTCAALDTAVADEAPDVVHVNGLMFGPQVVALRRRLPASCAIVVQDHAGRRPPGGRWWHVGRRRRVRALLRGLGEADAFLFTAREQAAGWRAAGVIAPGQAVYAIPESSTTLRPVARDRARAESGVDGEPALLWVGRLDANKDPLTVLDGFDRTRAALPRAHLTMVFGEDALVGDVQRRLGRSPALAAAVRLQGRVPHERMAAFYSAADLFVLGSHHEGSGYALIEALACGVVPVVTDIPPFRALVGAAPAALWAPGVATACAAAIERAAAGLSDATREMIRSHVDRELSWGAIGRRARGIYEEVLRARNPVPAAQV